MLMMALPQLSQLPVEILLAICAQLCHHCSEPDTRDLSPTREHSEKRLHLAALASLCRTSKAFYEIASPYLYHFVYHHRDDSGKLLPSLIRTVIQRPDLASLIQHIDVNHLNRCSTIPAEQLEAEFFDAAVQKNLRPLPGWASHPWSLLRVPISNSLPARHSECLFPHPGRVRHARYIRTYQCCGPNMHHLPRVRHQRSTGCPHVHQGLRAAGGFQALRLQRGHRNRGARVD
ncbi:hypothetical protein B0T16DRAFT_225442 [Cercophora newfieldiana]|uniref:F-box domain-containing protein n=1 Tax=Cercophora newfieldiana TaxID=92897 RepID=A0AA40CKT2_9PEZI|nr:hypothetical protein B0T16DRAFT_225442 [Cercophora newfieldiana]